MNCRQLPLKILISLAATVLGAIIVVGLNPRHSLFTNKVSRLTDGPGIRFRKYGIACTKPFDVPADFAPEMTDEPSGFSMEITFTSHHQGNSGFGILFMFHDGDDDTQLLMGQWRNHIVVMNGNDFDYSRKAPRVFVDLSGLPQAPVVATVTTDREGTRLYLNGQRISENKHLILRFPGGEHSSTLVMGNSVYGNTVWEGDIHGFAVYPHALAATAVSKHYTEWLKTHDFSHALTTGPSMLYLFDGQPGAPVLDRSGRGRHLEIPSRVTVLKHQFLAFSLEDFSLKSAFIQDVVVNLVGFVPFGLVFALLFRRGLLRIERHYVALAVILGFTLSLAIEIGQAWIPSRSSSLLDLVMNTAGTGIGALVHGFFCREKSLVLDTPS